MWKFSDHVSFENEDIEQENYHKSSHIHRSSKSLGSLSPFEPLTLEFNLFLLSYDNQFKRFILKKEILLIKISYWGWLAASSKIEVRILEKFWKKIIKGISVKNQFKMKRSLEIVSVHLLNVIFICDSILWSLVNPFLFSKNSLRKLYICKFIISQNSLNMLDLWSILFILV